MATRLPSRKPRSASIAVGIRLSASASAELGDSVSSDQKRRGRDEGLDLEHLTTAHQSEAAHEGASRQQRACATAAALGAMGLEVGVRAGSSAKALR
jgi:hypothetical protein